MPIYLEIYFREKENELLMWLLFSLQHKDSPSNTLIQTSTLGQKNCALKQHMGYKSSMYNKAVLIFLLIRGTVQHYQDNYFPPSSGGIAF